MLSLYSSSTRILSIRQRHLDNLLPILSNRVNELPPSGLKDFLTEWRISNILTDPPEFLEEHHINLLGELEGFSEAEWEEYLRIKKIRHSNRNDGQVQIFNKYSDLSTQIQAVFKYTGGFSLKSSPYSAYDLAEMLDIQTCTYCNRIYTKTVKNPAKITRPEFDHWFPKESYPLLSLSFYNLIPSCHVCNSSVKGSTRMRLNEFIHPYVDENINLSFSYDLDKYDKYVFKIKRIEGSREDNTIKAFKLEELYKTHEDEISDMVKIKKLYSIQYLLKLKRMLRTVDQNISLEELYRLAFGTYINELDFHKRPLSKMKKDILKELNIIK